MTDLFVPEFGLGVIAGLIIGMTIDKFVDFIWDYPAFLKYRRDRSRRE